MYFHLFVAVFLFYIFTLIINTAINNQSQGVDHSYCFFLFVFFKEGTTVILTVILYFLYILFLFTPHKYVSKSHYSDLKTFARIGKTK